jgi:hypothetical protein
MEAAMIERMIKNALTLAIWFVASGGLLLVNLIVLLANYLACKVSFELMGFEMQPLDQDRLIGRFAGAFFGRAAMADFYAMVVALTVAIGFFLLFKVLFTLPDHLEQRILHQQAGNTTEVRVRNIRLMFDVAAIGLLLAAGLAGAMLWDIELFRYRSLANAFAIEDPAVAPGSIPAWGPTLQQYGDLFAVQLAKVGPAGYVAVTMLACLALEYAFHKTHSAGTQLLRDVAAVAGGAPILPVADEVYMAGVSQYEADAQDVGQDPALAENLTSRSAGDAQLFDPARVGQGHAEPQQCAEPAPADELVEVIGGAPGEQVHRTDAQTEPDHYYVDDRTGVVWNRQYWESIHGTHDNEDQADAA